MRHSPPTTSRPRPMRASIDTRGRVRRSWRPAGGSRAILCPGRSSVTWRHVGALLPRHAGTTVEPRAWTRRTGLSRRTCDEPNEVMPQGDRAMRYLITGGAGFIGSHLAEALLARGDHVHVLDDLSTGSIAN